MSFKSVNHPVVSAISLLGFMALSSASFGVSLDSDSAKYSYTLGHQVAVQLKAKGVDVDGDAFAAAIADVLAGRDSQLTRAQMQTAVEVREAADEAKAAVLGDANRQAGIEFLAENAKQNGVVVLDNGLQYRVEVVGTGAMPGATDTVEVHYRGTLMDGTEFDSSHKRNKPATFQVNRVIAGFSEALQLMKVGSKWTVFIPGDLAYGERGIPSGAIGPNEMLIFELELLDVKS